VPHLIKVQNKKIHEGGEGNRRYLHCQNLNVWNFTNIKIMGNLHLHVVGINKQWVYNNMGQILKKTNIEDPILQLENV